jgi:hypothetical protein
MQYILQANQRSMQHYFIANHAIGSYPQLDQLNIFQVRTWERVVMTVKGREEVSVKIEEEEGKETWTIEVKGLFIFT